MSSRKSRPKQTGTENAGGKPAGRDFVEVIRLLASPGMEKNFARDITQLGWEWDDGTEAFWKGNVSLDSPKGADQDPVAFALRKAWRNCGHLFSLLQNAPPATLHAAAIAFSIGSTITDAQRRIISSVKKGRPTDDEAALFYEIQKAAERFWSVPKNRSLKFQFKNAKDEAYWDKSCGFSLTPQKFTMWKKSGVGFLFGGERFPITGKIREGANCGA